MPALHVAFQYEVRSREVRVVEPAPVFQPYFSLGTYYPWGGIGVSGPIGWGWPYYGSRDFTTFTRSLRMVFSDARGLATGTVTEAPRILEATARNRGSEPAALDALPILVNALLADFPGRSGVARRVELAPPQTSAPAPAR